MTALAGNYLVRSHTHHSFINTISQPASRTSWRKSSITLYPRMRISQCAYYSMPGTTKSKFPLMKRPIESLAFFQSVPTLWPWQKCEFLSKQEYIAGKLKVVTVVILMWTNLSLCVKRLVDGSEMNLDFFGAVQPQFQLAAALLFYWSTRLYRTKIHWGAQLYCSS